MASPQPHRDWTDLPHLHWRTSLWIKPPMPQPPQPPSPPTWWAWESLLHYQPSWLNQIPVRSSEKVREGKQKGAQPHNCHLKVNDLGLTVGCKHLGLLCFSRHVMASKLMIRNSPSTALTVPQNNLLTLEMYKIRDGFTRKSCYSFGFCSNDRGGGDNLDKIQKNSNYFSWNNP